MVGISANGKGGSRYSSVNLVIFVVTEVGVVEIAHRTLLEGDDVCASHG